MVSKGPGVWTVSPGSRDVAALLYSNGGARMRSDGATMTLSFRTQSPADTVPSVETKKLGFDAKFYVSDGQFYQAPCIVEGSGKFVPMNLQVNLTQSI